MGDGRWRRGGRGVVMILIDWGRRQFVVIGGGWLLFDAVAGGS